MWESPIHRINFSLRNSGRRSKVASDRIEFHDYALERQVQDRLLDELLAEKPSLRFVPPEPEPESKSGTLDGD